MEPPILKSENNFEKDVRFSKKFFKYYIFYPEKDMLFISYIKRNI